MSESNNTRFPAIRRTAHPASQRLPFALIACALLSAVCPAAVDAALPGGQALRTRDEFVRRKFDKAVETYAGGRYDDARRSFEGLLDEPALSPRGREIVEFMVGKCLFRSAKYDSCRAYFTAFLEIHPRSPYAGEAHIYLGHCLFFRENHLGAARHYSHAAQIGPERTGALAEENLEPLITRGLSTAQLDSLAGETRPEGAGADILIRIAERWEALGRRARAETVYRLLATEARRTPAGRLAASRIEAVDQERRSVANIGVLAPLSGDYADYGRELEQGIRLAAELNGDQTRLHFADTRGDSAGAAKAARLLLTKGCDAIIGPLVPEAIFAGTAILKDHDVVQILPLSRRGDYAGLSPRVHQLSNSPRRQARRLAEYAVREGQMKRLGVLAPDSPEGRIVAETFATFCAASGAFVHEPALFGHDATEFGPLLQVWRDTDVRFTCDTAGISYASLKPEAQEAVRPSLDGILIWGEPEDLLLAVPQVRFQGYRVQFLGSSSWEETNLLGRIRTVFDSVIFASDEVIDTSRMAWKQFRTQYRERWRAEPTTLAARGYDLVRWILGDERDDRRAPAIAARLTDSGGFDGVGGRVTLGADRRPANVPLYRFRNASPVRVPDN